MRKRDNKLTEPLHIRLSEKLHDKLVEMANKKAIHKSSLVRMILKEYLNGKVK